MDELIEEFLYNFEDFIHNKPESEFPGYYNKNVRSKSRFNDATLD